MRRASPLLVVFLTLTSVAVAQEGSSCPDPTFQPRLMTPPARRLPRDASLVVGLFPGGTFADLPAVTLTRRNRAISLVREEIAPGLFRLRPDARRIYGRWALSGVPGAPPLVFGRPGIGAAPTQPRLDRVERYLVATGGESQTEVRLHLRFPMPEGVVAIVVYWGDDPAPDLFVRAIPTSSDVVLYRSGSDCGELPRGASAPPSDGPVRVAFVGRYGQMSPRSDAVSLGD